MSDYFIIPRQALVEAENLCNEIYNAESIIYIHEKVDEIKKLINEAIPCNVKPEGAT